MAAVARVRAAAERVAPYAFTAAHGITMAVGGVAGGYVRKFLKKNKTYAQYIEATLRDWAPLGTAILVAVGYAFARDFIMQYVPQEYQEYLDEIVIGIIAGFAARQGGIFAGDTELFVSGKAKILAKNVGEVRQVIVDGNDVTASVKISGEEIDLSNSGVAEGEHDVIVIGDKKAAYEHLYIPM